MGLYSVNEVHLYMSADKGQPAIPDRSVSLGSTCALAIKLQRGPGAPYGRHPERQATRRRERLSFQISSRMLVREPPVAAGENTKLLSCLPSSCQERRDPKTVGFMILPQKSTLGHPTLPSNSVSSTVSAAPINSASISLLVRPPASSILRNPLPFEAAKHWSWSGRF